MAVKFNRYNVRDTETGKTARVSYSVNNHVSCFDAHGVRNGRQHVTVYAKDYNNALAAIIPAGYVDNTEIQSDYFEKGRVYIADNHPLFAAAMSAATRAN